MSTALKVRRVSVRPDVSPVITKNPVIVIEVPPVVEVGLQILAGFESNAPIMTQSGEAPQADEPIGECPALPPGSVFKLEGPKE